MYQLSIIVIRYVSYIITPAEQYTHLLIPASSPPPSDSTVPSHFLPSRSLVTTRASHPTTHGNTYNSMDSRFVPLVIFLLLFASITMALPTDGTEEAYPDEGVLDDLAGLAMNLWDYVIDLPLTADQYTVLGNVDGAVASPATPQGVFQYPSPNPNNLYPYVYPPAVMDLNEVQHNTQLQSQLQTPEEQMQASTGRRPDLCAMNVMQMDEHHAQMTDIVQDWVDDAYATGCRNQTGGFQQTPLPRQIAPHPSPVDHMHATPSSVVPTQAQQPYIPTGQPSISSASVGYLTCDEPGCSYTCQRRCDMSHHLRYHVPAHRRPHHCPLCHRRFLYPREVRRHMPTHGIGTRHCCPIPRCPYATRGFGRRDHLLRHLRNRHATPSQTETESVAE